MYNIRKLAVDILSAVYYEGAYSNITLNKYIKKYEVEPRDRGLLTQIVYGTIKNSLYLDHIINTYSKVKVKKMKPLIATVLRMSIYQLLYLDKVPESAVCNEAVKIVKKTRLKNLSGFVNGVLRSVIRGDKDIVMPKKGKDTVGYLSLTYSFPKWLIEKWSQELGGFEEVEKLLEAMNETPDLTIRTNTLKTTPEKLYDQLVQAGYQVEQPSFPAEGLVIKNSSDVAKIPGFKEGLFTVQDRSSMLIPYAAGVKKGDLVLDVCAAPGGKSTHMATKMEDEGQVIARDVYAHKLDLIEETCKRLGLKSVKTELKDAMLLDKNLIGKADVVLVDAPCSGLGIINKKPDIKLTKSQEDLDDLQNVQQEILLKASQYVKDQGTLIYSTCTLNKKENEEMVDWFIKNQPFKLESLEGYLPDKVDCDTMRDGYVRLTPHQHDTDGFFIARMVREDR